MLNLRRETLQINDIDEDFELEITVVNADNPGEYETSFINEAQAKQIVEHFKTQFSWPDN